jgi:hypothetical protein
LHHQAARGRNVIVTENPQLHLIWANDRIFIKPIPPYLLSFAFWEFLQRKDPLFRAAAGFLRSYSYLIRYETDFRLAFSDALSLIPTSGSNTPITFEQFSRFIAPFSLLDDSAVNPRYHYGELRLSRLNTCTRLFLGKFTFHHIHAQWGTYLGRLLAPTLSVFAGLSVVLSAMQVGLATKDLSPTPHWSSFLQISRWSSVITLVLVAFVVIFLLSLIVFMFIHDIWFARRVLRQKEKGHVDSLPEFKSGVI